MPGTYTKLMPEKLSSATDQEMSKTTLNKGQRQMDGVRKSLGFRTSRDPLQENSSQGLEGIKDKNAHPYEEWFALERLLKKSPPGFALWNVMTLPAR